jgi:hypothetical protein
MIKFFKGLEASLPTAGANGALYITTDEGGIYLGTGTGMKRLGDFVQVDAVANLPAKAHEGCLYYCVAENILAKWNGTEWKQINKQPTAEEMKTLLGLGSLAYKSEVAEGDLNADLKAKVNAAAEGNHSHANKALLDTYTQTEADLADAVAKKHAHANADELAKIADGDKAKWDAVVADHLTSADKTTLEDAIKEAKKAGTDANTNVEAYKVTNDARVKAVEDDVAEITDGTNGILAQAKAYADGKDDAIAAAKKAGDDAQADIDAYIESNNTALAGVKATAEAAATKAYTDEELAKKVDKVEGKSLIADTEIARLATLANYDDTQVKADIAKKADAETMTTELGKKVDKVEGYSLVSDTEIARLADVDNYDDAEVRGLIGDNADAIAAINSAETGILKQAKDYADGKDEAITAATTAADKAQEEVDALETYVGTIPTDEQYADITNVISYIDKKAEETLSAAQGDSSETVASVKQQLDNYKSENDTRVKAAEDAIDAIEADYLKAADKTELQNQITANANAITLLTEGADPDKVDSVKDLIDYVDKHGAEVTGMKEDIENNAQALSEYQTFVDETYASASDVTAAHQSISALEEKVDVEKVSTAISDAVKVETDRATGVENGLAGRIKDLEDNKAGYATTGQVATAKQEAIDAAATDAQGKVDALANGQVKANTEAIATKANAADVYAKTETYTQAEVDALISAAHTWGEF